MSDDEKVILESKVKNMIVQYLTGIMKNDISDAEHFIKDQPKEYALNIINDMITNNCRKMYDELNVSNIRISNGIHSNNEVIYQVSATIKSLDYMMDLSSGERYGSHNTRGEREINLKVVKKNNTTQDSVMRCPGCGHSIDVYYSGKCENCGSIFNLEDYDYQILEISKNLM